MKRTGNLPHLALRSNVFKPNVLLKIWTKITTFRKKLHACMISNLTLIHELDLITFIVKAHNLWDTLSCFRWTQSFVDPSKPTPASVASVGAALCLKIHFFSGKFLDCFIEAAQNFIKKQKTSLTKLVLKNSVWKQSIPNFQHKLL